MHPILGNKKLILVVALAGVLAYFYTRNTRHASELLPTVEAKTVSVNSSHSTSTIAGNSIKNGKADEVNISEQVETETSEQVNLIKEAYGLVDPSVAEVKISPLGLEKLNLTPELARLIEKIFNSVDTEISSSEKLFSVWNAKDGYLEVSLPTSEVDKIYLKYAQELANAVVGEGGIFLIEAYNQIQKNSVAKLRRRVRYLPEVQEQGHTYTAGYELQMWNDSGGYWTLLRSARTTSKVNLIGTPIEEMMTDRSFSRYRQHFIELSREK